MRQSLESSPSLDDAAEVKKWDRFFKTYYKAQLNEAALPPSGSGSAWTPARTPTAPSSPSEAPPAVDAPAPGETTPPTGAPAPTFPSNAEGSARRSVVRRADTERRDAITLRSENALVVDYYDIDRYDPDLALDLLDHPTRSIERAERALADIMAAQGSGSLGLAEDSPLTSTAHGGAAGERRHVYVRLVHLPEHATVEVRSLRAEHLGKLIAVRGLVKKATEVRPKIADAVFECQRCHAKIREPQDEHMVLKEPIECYEDQDGCGRSTSFKLLVEPSFDARGAQDFVRSRFINSQKVEIQEAPEEMRGGEQPQRLTAFVEDDLCGLTTPGDRITINGILRASLKKVAGVKSTLFDIHLEVVSVEREQQMFDEVSISPEEEEEIKRFSRNPEIYEKLTASIAPSIFGLSVEKRALLFQLFGGVEKKLPDNTRLRGDIHVLLVGDPGVAKSQLIRYMSKLAPRGIYTSGKSSSGAGLTAAAVKDEFGEGRWTLEAGAMVLADRGLLCVDEIDKMEKEDQSSMHEGMEQQTISVAKAGITATLQSRCSVLGAANPKLGRFDEFQSLAEQINFPPALLSRFDVIFTLKDKPEPVRDLQLASHMLEVQRGGEMHEHFKVNPDGPWGAEAVEAALRAVDPEVSSEFLRKYVAHAKRNAFPVLSEDAVGHLRDYYVSLRRGAQSTDGKGGPIPLTPRQLEALVRLAEASARVRLSNEVAREDTERAIEIVEYYMKRLSGGEGGIMDVDLQASGISHSQRQSIPRVKELIRDLSADTDNGVALEDLLGAAEREGIQRERALEILKRLRSLGEVYSPRSDHFRVAGGRGA
ncbi:MAG: minichromosome maintenance protein MCM [Thermoplasmatota archaeon]